MICGKPNFFILFCINFRLNIRYKSPCVENAADSISVEPVKQNKKVMPNINTSENVDNNNSINFQIAKLYVNCIKYQVKLLTFLLFIITITFKDGFEVRKEIDSGN